MEKLIYTNQLGERVEISATPPFLLERKEGFGAIKNKIGTSNSYGQDGETVVNESLEKRDMSIEGNILARSREELLRLRRKLVRVFNPKASGKLTYENDIGVWEIYCKVECAPVFPYENYEITQKFLIQLMGPNPLWKSIKEHETTLVSWIPNLEFPIEEDEEKEFFHTEQTPNYWLETEKTDVKGRNLIQQKYISPHGCKMSLAESYNSIPTYLVEVTNPNEQNNFGIRLNSNIEGIGLDGYLTLSFYYQVISYKAPRNMLGYVEVQYEDNSLERFGYSEIIINDLNEQSNWRQWFKLNFSFKTNPNKKLKAITKFYFYADFVEDYSNVRVTLPKLEKGDKPTQWTPAPEDTFFEEFQSEFGKGVGQEWGYRVLKRIVEINNIGDVECSLKVVFRASGDVEKPYIQDVNTYELIRINKTLKSGDILEITTGYGNKNVYLNGKKAHQYLDFLNSTWLQLKPGVNLIKYGAENNLNNLECTVFYTPLYLGV